MAALGLTYENGYRDGTVTSAGMKTNDVTAQLIRYRHRLELTPRAGGLHDYIRGLLAAYQDEIESRNPNGQAARLPVPPPPPPVRLHR